MGVDRNISLVIDGKTVGSLRVIFRENDVEPDELVVEVRRSAGGPIVAKAQWHVLESNGEFVLQITSQSVATGICLAGCLAGIVPSVGPFKDCLRKAKDRKAVRKCISEHAVWQAVGALSCIYGCLNL